MSMDAAERKRRQRERVRGAGLVKVESWVAAEQVEVLKAFAKSLPPPAAPKDARQLDMIEQIEAKTQGSMGPCKKTDESQGSLL